ncbi:hypothetical protein [Frankia sp. CiP3]|uniref:hypothetical protein n=1 Tax=Frankia sp. CiP3 TaxID=2880971 RepID=UPI001EF49D21|nr:hypothetical protein [Frankia sp. CiP3]
MPGIAAWEDDPVAAPLEDQPRNNRRIFPSVPVLNQGVLPVDIDPKVQRPQPEIHEVDTREFRYWALAEALSRAAGYWSARVPAGTTWHPGNGNTLIAYPDDGEDLNAYYDRNGLHFFHGAVRGRTVYSGESPDVVCHELGHAVLDAVKPELFDTASIEVAAFHEAFADCSAILSDLQLPSLRQAVLDETNGRIATASRLSQLAENLGWAIRQLAPDSVDPDCLRSAVNSFYYQAPASLPPRAPATSISSEPHSFARVFTAGFLRTLDHMFHLQPQQDADGLLRAAEDAGTLLIEGVRGAPVVPGFYAQVAAHMIAVDASRFGGKYRDAIRAGFTGTGVLSVRSAAALGSVERLNAATPAEPDGHQEPARVRLPSTSFGLPKDLWVQTASQARRHSVASGLADVGDAPTPVPDEAAASFVEDLVRRGRIAVEAAQRGDAPITAAASTTHRIEATDGALTLRRERFDRSYTLN